MNDVKYYVMKFFMSSQVEMHTLGAKGLFVGNGHEISLLMILPYFI